MENTAIEHESLTVCQHLEDSTFACSTDMRIEPIARVVLHANVGYPADPATQQRVLGKFPVLLTQNPCIGGENPDVFALHAVTSTS